MRVFLMGCVLLFPHLAYGQGFSPEQALARMKVADGFQVRLLAAEPEVRQPVAVEFDDRGRPWVIQYLQYPNPSGLKRLQVDRYSRTRYDRIPEPPPHGPKGADRITILEGRGPDGRARRTKDFVTGLNLATGLAFGHGGVYVLQTPYLLFYPDRNGDDIPDGDPDVLVRGFGMEDAHSVANSLTWGPDGWLYGCQGSTVTATIGNVEFQQGVWRFHPLTRRFELFCEGGGNSWGLDFDRDGHLLYSTNVGGHTALHGVQGAYYWKSFGKHGALHNPFAYGYFDHVPHRNFRGGHVTVGGTFYGGTTFPERFRGKLIAGDLLGHGVYWHDVIPEGSTFRSAHGGELLVAEDTWFAPTDVTLGPDGSLYVSDWYDRRTAHPDPDAEWDRSNGRIYEISAKNAAPWTPVDVTKLPSHRLVELLSDRNDWIVRRARRVLADRRDPEVIWPLRRLVVEAKDPEWQLQALWALHGSGGLSEAFALECLAHGNPAVRRWTVRLLGDDSTVSPVVAARLGELAARETNAHVRSQLACTARRLPLDDGLAIIDGLFRYDRDIKDPHIPLLLWWAVETHAGSAPQRVVEMLACGPHRERPLVREVLLDRLMRRYAADGSPLAAQACVTLVEAAGVQDRSRALAALEQGLGERTRSRESQSGTLFTNLAAVERNVSSRQPLPLPEPVKSTIRRLWDPLTQDPVLIRLGIRAELPEATRRALAFVADEQSPAPVRLALLGFLGDMGCAESVPVLLRLVESTREPSALAAVDALERFESVDIARALLERHGTLAPRVRARVATAMLGRRSWAKVFLDAIHSGRIPATEVPSEALRLVALHKDKSLDDLVRRYWGTIKAGTPEEKLAEMRRLSNDLRAGSGNLHSGKTLFTKHCGQCHRIFGEGELTGPELTHANRKDRDFLLASIVDPSAVIRKEYLAYNAHLRDGRTFTGLIVAQTPGTITLVNARNEKTQVPRERLESLEESPNSLMPEGILKDLRPQEVRDLFAYLQSEKGL